MRVYWCSIGLSTAVPVFKFCLRAFCGSCGCWTFTFWLFYRVFRFFQVFKFFCCVNLSVYMLQISSNKAIFFCFPAPGWGASLICDFDAVLSRLCDNKNIETPQLVRPFQYWNFFENRREFNFYWGIILFTKRMEIVGILFWIHN